MDRNTLVYSLSASELGLVIQCVDMVTHDLDYRVVNPQKHGHDFFSVSAEDR